MKARRPSTGRRRWLAFGGAAVLSLLLYLPTVRYDFVWDDILAIKDNEYLGQTSLLRILASDYTLNPRVGTCGCARVTAEPTDLIRFCQTAPDGLCIRFRVK